MSNRKNTNKKVLFLPVSVHPLGDRVLSNYLASKTIHFRPKKPGALSYFFPVVHLSEMLYVNGRRQYN